MTEPNEVNLKRGLATWCEKNSIRPTQFARALGYKNPSAYGWSLLRGKVEVTAETLGRFILAYGTQAASEVLDLAGFSQTATLLPIGAPADADPQAERPMLLRGVRMPDPGRAIDSTAPQAA